LCLAFVSLVLLPSCISADVSVGTATEGEITVYTALQEKQIPAYLAAFQAKYPDIEVNVVRESTGIITDKLLAEKDNPPADVVWGVAATSLLLGEWNEILQAYAPAGLERVVPQFRDPANPPYWVGIDLWMSAFCVNTEEIEKRGLPIPQSWSDLVAPAYKGHIVMSNPNSSGTGFLSVSGVLQIYEEEKGWQYLEQLHQNIGEYTESGSKPCKLAGAGEYAIGISFGFQGIIEKANGKPIKTVFPTEGSGWEIEANALVSKEDIKPAAKTFLDWAISDNAMKEYAQNWAVTSVKTDQPIPEGFPADPTTQLIDNDFPWAAANRQGILSEWQAFDDRSTEAKDEEG
jgi:iron(III) transport system substrate-binding protein